MMILIVYGSILTEVCLSIYKMNIIFLILIFVISPRSGIRSKEAQRQFEAILKMPGLFKKETTSTTLISAAFMKLATLFQEGYLIFFKFNLPTFLLVNFIKSGFGVFKLVKNYNNSIKFKKKQGHSFQI